MFSSVRKLLTIVHDYSAENSKNDVSWGLSKDMIGTKTDT